MWLCQIGGKVVVIYFPSPALSKLMDIFFSCHLLPSLPFCKGNLNGRIIRFDHPVFRQNRIVIYIQEESWMPMISCDYILWAELEIYDI